MIYSLGVLGTLLHILGTLQYSYATGNIVTIFKGYLNVPAMLQAIAIFTWFKYLPEKWYTGKIWENVNWFSSVTFGVYLVHKFVIVLIERYTPVDQTSLTYRTLGAIGIFLLSAVIVKTYQLVVRKVKIDR